MAQQFTPQQYNASLLALRQQYNASLLTPQQYNASLLALTQQYNAWMATATLAQQYNASLLAPPNIPNITLAQQYNASLATPNIPPPPNIPPYIPPNIPPYIPPMNPGSGPANLNALNAGLFVSNAISNANTYDYNRVVATAAYHAARASATAKAVAAAKAGLVLTPFQVMLLRQSPVPLTRLTNSPTSSRSSSNSIGSPPPLTRQSRRSSSSNSIGPPPPPLTRQSRRSSPNSLGLPSLTRQSSSPNSPLRRLPSWNSWNRQCSSNSPPPRLVRQTNSPLSRSSSNSLSPLSPLSRPPPLLGRYNGQSSPTSPSYLPPYIPQSPSQMIHPSRIQLPLAPLVRSNGSSPLGSHYSNDILPLFGGKSKRKTKRSKSTRKK